jgi:hypothetical protein
MEFFEQKLGPVAVPGLISGTPNRDKAMNMIKNGRS